jgi:hypothetical protein
MIRKLIIKSQKGVMLFEVLVAVLVLAVGITGTLQAFNSIVQVTKRSRDLFEARFVAADSMFELFALPEAMDHGKLNSRYPFENDDMQLSKAYMVTNQIVEIPYPIEDAELEKTGVERIEPVSFARITTTIAHEQQKVYGLETFHAFPNED